MKDIDAHIISVVFKAARFNPYSTAHSKLDDLRRLVPFAGVCRMWRKPLLRYLYNDIIRVEHRYSIHMPPEKTAWYTTSNQYCRDIWCWWDSNIELVGCNGFSSTTTQLQISMDYPRRWDKISLDEVLSKLKLDLYKWPNLTCLLTSNTIGPHLDPGLLRLQNKRMAADSTGAEESAQKTADYLKSFLPHIYSLPIKCYFISDPFTELLNNKILYQYLPQLVKMDIQEPIDLNIPNNLVEITFSLGHSNLLWFPPFDPDKLKKLSLHLKPSVFAWSWLLNSTTTEIRLNGLVNLCLYFTDRYDGNGGPSGSNSSSSRPLQLEDKSKLKTEDLEPVSVLELPNLQYLYIDGAPNNDQLFKPIIKLGDCVDIFLSGKLENLLNCTNIQYEEAWHYTISIKELVPEEMDDFYELTDQLFGSFLLATKMTLSIGSKTSIDLEADVLQWFNLTRLQLNFNAKFAMVLDIVPQIPNLAYLYIDWLTIQDQDIALLSERGKKKLVLAWETRTKELSVYAKRYVKGPKQSANPDLVVHLAKRMLLLEKLHVPTSISSEVKDELLCQAPWYPHLQNVDI